MAWMPKFSSAKGFTLIEMMLVLIIVGAVISAAATIVPATMKTAKLKEARAVSEKMDVTLEGYFAANGRLPCPDTDVTFNPASAETGVENRNNNNTPTNFADDTCASYEGWLPYKTLGLSVGTDAWGMPYRYGVHQALISTSPQTVCGNAAFSAAASTDFLHVLRDDNTPINYAYILVSGGELIPGKTHTIIGGRFDGLNDDSNLRFEAPERNVSIVDGSPNTSYNDLVRGVGLVNLQGEQCSGSLTSTSGSGTTQTGVENTNDLCRDNQDNDKDNKIDCNDQDCFGFASCLTPTGATITVTSLTPNATAGSYYCSNAPSAIGGSNTFYWDLVGETLANTTLTVNTNNGVVCGTIGECPGTYTNQVTLKATDRNTPNTSDTEALTLTVDPPTSQLKIEPSSGPLVTTTPNLTYNSGDMSVVQYFTLTGPSMGTITWPAAPEFTDGDPTGFSLTQDAVDPKKVKLWISGNPVGREQNYTFKIKATSGSNCATSQSVYSDQYSMYIAANMSQPPAYEVDMFADWRFDECSWSGVAGEVKDSGGSLHGKGVLVAGGTQTNSTSMGRLCRGGMFQGTTGKNYIHVPHNTSLSLGDNFTISAWVWLDANVTTPTPIRLVGKGNSANRSYGMWLQNGRIIFRIYPTTGTAEKVLTSTNNAAGKVNVGKWRHVALTYDESTMRIFIDGVQNTSTTYSSSPKTNTLPLTIGFAAADDLGNAGGYAASGNSGSTYFNGMLDEVRIWKRALPTNEILDLYNATAGRTCAGSCYSLPIARYILDADALDSNGLYAGTVSGVLAYDTVNYKEGCGSASFITGTSAAILVDPVSPLDDTGLATAAFWMKWNGSNDRRVLNIGNSAHSLWFKNDKFGFSTGTNNLKGIAVTTFANQWRHIVATFVNNNKYLYQMYVDGVQQALAMQNNTSINNVALRAIGTRYRLGHWEGGGSYYYQGNLDDVRIYNRGLAANEVKALYDETLDACTP